MFIHNDCPGSVTELQYLICKFKFRMPGRSLTWMYPTNAWTFLPAIDLKSAIFKLMSLNRFKVRLVCKAENAIIKVKTIKIKCFAKCPWRAYRCEYLIFASSHLIIAPREDETNNNFDGVFSPIIFKTINNDEKIFYAPCFNGNCHLIFIPFFSSRYLDNR